jgi:hypothetical protein
MEDVVLIYPDFEDHIILNYFKGTIIKNDVDAIFFFENNNLKIKWNNNNENIDEFYLDTINNELTRYIYIQPAKTKLDIKSIDNNILTKIYIKDNYWESSCIIDNCYIYNELNNYKGIYSFKDDILNIKWEHDGVLKKYFQESNNSTNYFLCSDYEKNITLFNINTNTGEFNEFMYIINIKNLNIYSINADDLYNSDKKIGHFNIHNEIITFYIKNNEYLYECLDNNLSQEYYYSITLFKNNYYKNIILNNKYYIFDKINNVLFEKYNRQDGITLYNIILKDNKIITDNKIFECDFYIDNIDNTDINNKIHNYYDNTAKYNKTIYIIHETWEEECIINVYLNSFYRLSTNEYENMIINDYFLIVHWKMWSPELFLINGDYHENNTYNNSIKTIYKHYVYYDFLLKNDFLVVHKNWKDLCKIHDLKIIRQSNQEDGLFKLSENNNIIIKWTKWNEESFYILNNVLYSIEFIYYIYDNSNNTINKPLYILNKYNNELFKINHSISILNAEYLEKIEFIQDDKLKINEIIYFYKCDDYNIYIYNDCFETKTLFKENEFNVKLNIITNEVIYEKYINNNIEIIYGKYFIEKDDINESIYLNIYWNDCSYNEIYRLLNNNVYYYEKYLNYSLKKTYILYVDKEDYNYINDIEFYENILSNTDGFLKEFSNDFSFSFDYFNRRLYNDIYSIHFLKNTTGDKFYLLINDEIKEFCIYNFDDDIMFLLDYNYNYLNNDKFIPDIYKTYLLYKIKLRSSLLNNISDINLFKLFLKQKINNNDIYSYKSFIKQYLKDIDYNKHENQQLFYKDIIKFIKDGELIKIYEKEPVKRKSASKSIIILTYDDIDLYNIEFIKNIYDSNLKYDIIINFNIENISFINIVQYYYLINLSHITITISCNLLKYQILYELNKYISVDYDNIIYLKNNTSCDSNNLLFNKNDEDLNNCFSLINYNKLLVMNNNVESTSKYKLLKINYFNKKMKYFEELYNIVYSKVDLIQVIIFYYILNRYLYKIVDYDFIIKTELMNHILV